ncbi:MAG TPA: amidohydrolase family protein, partial [Lentisphaeria bacterium]|nr:amidohydrolase family protein [Lentisphaeria bacterium]
LLFHQGLQRVRRLTQLPLAQLVKTTAWNQARSLGFSDRGKIEPGFRADLVRMSADLEPKQAWVAGQKRL